MEPRAGIVASADGGCGRWALPGGAIEIGERADEAAVREIGEETGFVVEVVRLVGVYSVHARTRRLRIRMGM